MCDGQKKVVHESEAGEFAAFMCRIRGCVSAWPPQFRMEGWKWCDYIDRLEAELVKLRGTYEHPESFCDECGGKNITWYADNDLWNKVMGDRGAIVCPLCFAKIAEATGKIGLAVWRLAETDSSPEIDKLRLELSDSKNESHLLFTDKKELEAKNSQLCTAADKIGMWLSAALDDDKVCVEMKSDIREWMDAVYSDDTSEKESPAT